MSDADVEALAGSATVATVLPGADFSTRSVYADARRMIDAGVVVAIATDCNPGSSYTTSMPFCIAVAVRDMHLTPAEALWAATAGGARALRRDDIGVLAVGKRADFAVIAAPSYVHLAYRPGVALVTRNLEVGHLAIGCAHARVASQRSRTRSCAHAAGSCTVFGVRTCVRKVSVVVDSFVAC